MFRFPMFSVSTRKVGKEQNHESKVDDEYDARGVEHKETEEVHLFPILSCLPFEPPTMFVFPSPCSGTVLCFSYARC